MTPTEEEFEKWWTQQVRCGFDVPDSQKHAAMTGYLAAALKAKEEAERDVIPTRDNAGCVIYAEDFQNAVKKIRHAAFWAAGMWHVPGFGPGTYVPLTIRECTAIEAVLPKTDQIRAALSGDKP